MVIVSEFDDDVGFDFESKVILVYVDTRTW